ncbi:hypothetical protein RirG_266150 [Rhizophagus irregularis DAOM 197198w]|uniref:Uncharacterized protein n=2 Tax=Rhizophagus irregularis TaxID=588596 RepID=A0A015L7Y3_RHIIW|nr:hypothetical protein RirG_266150 [Rhizophagus irregularis DAOM 197198w]
MKKVLARSAWSRAKHPVIEIGDLGNEESMKYLTGKRKINEVEAKILYELVGVIKQSILAEVEKKFNTVQLLRKQLYHEVGRKQSRLKELDFTTFMEFFDNYEEADKVLETNIFSYHPEKNIVTFRSQSVESYVREKADI